MIRTILAKSVLARHAAAPADTIEPVPVRASHPRLAAVGNR